ncbi:hypothetical protein VSS74_03685 [Conexibacter stalactiti]|uniref:4,5-dihydroxyphthalate decarboxylase n=1 Tax=Conexibacter stalactiti TaxID=1940611 RepID=A0ABU4HJD5_9ACTN|nr:hypothetical protein [Conexibacter stalactiti]MDW5593424.1 hypothetical protein [Conexibacter stalactiti]MEC5034065.1 hypothetical protein [Conexibacter stalactiti]
MKVEGVALTSLDLSPEEVFFRFVAFREWDVSELSFAKYASMRAAGDSSLVALPVFTSRVFRHSAIYVRAGSGVRSDALAGARIGVAEWAQTAGVYARALLMHEFGLDLAQARWFQGGVNQPGRHEQARLALPDGVRITPVADRSLTQMLCEGDLDVVISARPPDGFGAGAPVDRLFPDHRVRELEYGARTGIVPIMHLVVVRGETVERHPWVPMNLLGAFERSKRNALERIGEPGLSRTPLLWPGDALQEARELFGGPDAWPYGLEANRPTIDAFLGFCHEQGVAARRLAPEDLFPETVLSTYKV